MKERQHPRPVKLQITHTHIQKQTKKRGLASRIYAIAKNKQRKQACHTTTNSRLGMAWHREKHQGRTGV
jgi:predicted GNAT family acetyltransferase